MTFIHPIDWSITKTIHWQHQSFYKCDMTVAIILTNTIDLQTLQYSSRNNDYYNYNTVLSGYTITHYL